MNIRKTFTVLAFVVALIMLPVARADQSNEATKVTFSQPVQIPGRVLPAGTYWFMLPNDNTLHDQVRIYNSDRTIFYATVISVTAQRLQPTDKTTFTLTAREPKQPEAIIYWFYPGSTTGHEFLYPAKMWKELAKNKQVTVDAGD
jgi:Protein of unknown function (DUF2911)